MSEWSNRLFNESIKKRNNWKSVDHAKITNKKNLKIQTIQQSILIVLI